MAIYIYITRCTTLFLATIGSPMKSTKDKEVPPEEPIKRTTFAEPSTPKMALKNSVSSTTFLKRQLSTTQDEADNESDNDNFKSFSTLQLEKSNSKMQTKSPEPSGSSQELKTNNSKVQVKLESNVSTSFQLKRNSFSSVLSVKAGAPPPLRLSPETQLHIRQPFKILTDIWGVLVSYEFQKTLFKYIDDNLKKYIIEHFEEIETIDYVNKLASKTEKDLAKGDWPTMPSVPKLPEEVDELKKIQVDKETVAETVVRNLAFRKETKDKSLLIDLETIYSQVWNDGYRSKTLRPLSFADVLPNLLKWTSEPLYIKVYTFATGPPEMQKLFLSATTEGDIGQCMTAFFDTHHTFKYNSERFRQVVSGLSERDPKNLFYFTDSPKKGYEARKAGLSVFIVRREGNKKYKQEYLDKFTVTDTFDQFDFFEF